MDRVWLYYLRHKKLLILFFIVLFLIIPNIFLVNRLMTTKEEANAGLICPNGYSLVNSRCEKRSPQCSSSQCAQYTQPLSYQIDSSSLSTGYCSPNEVDPSKQSATCYFALSGAPANVQYSLPPSGVTAWISTSQGRSNQCSVGGVYLVCNGIPTAGGILGNQIATTSLGGTVPIIYARVLTGVDVKNFVCSKRIITLGEEIECVASFDKFHTGTIAFTSRVGSCTTPRISIEDTSAKCVFVPTTSGIDWVIDTKPSGGGTGVNTLISILEPEIEESGGADLSLTKRLEGVLVSGLTTDYLLQLTNNGDITSISPITITDTLPQQLQYISYSADTTAMCEENQQRVVCSVLTDIAPRSTIEIRIKVRVI